MDRKISRIVRERIGAYEYGFDERHVKCSAMRATLNYLESTMGGAYVSRLISILNDCTGKKFFTRDYLYSDMNWVSYEVYQSMLEIAKEITGDRNFCYNAGLSFFRLNQGGLITLGKYLGSPHQLYMKVPGFVRKYNNQINLDVVEVHSNRATIIMSLRPKFRKRAGHRRFFFKNGCDLVKGVLQGIPTLFDFPLAEVADVSCMGHGDDVCEWKFVWKKAPLAKRFWHTIVAQDYKKLMKEQNQELSRTIVELERKFEELQDKNKEILSYQEQLIEKEKLESAVRLLSDLAHDLKTPLTMISGYAQLFKTGSIPPENTPEYSELILEQSSRTVLIIQELLNYLRGKPPSLNKESVCAREYIEGFYNEIRPGMEARNIKAELFTNSLEGEKLLIDRENFRRAIHNICKNAKEAMPNGGGLVIDAKQDDGCIEFSFIDSGVGISRERQKEIFKRFVTYKKDGTGLGMGIAKSIVEAHGGEISLKSRLNKGTTVTVRLPKG